IKAYIRFIADWRLRQLGLPQVYAVGENPLPWLQSMLSGVEHANFFEARATEYSKAATKGQWHGAEGVWAGFDAMLAQRGAPGPGTVRGPARRGGGRGRRASGPASAR